MKRERYNTTLKPDSRKKLLKLAGLNGFKHENEMIEYMIDVEWGKYINEMGNENNRRIETK